MLNRIRRGLYGVFAVVAATLMILRCAPLIPLSWILPQDYTRFWYVGERLLWVRAPALAPLGPSALAALHPLNLLSSAAGFQAWLYPPTLNNVAMLFALLPLPASYVAWDAASLFAAAWLLRQAGLGWPALVIGLASPSDFFSLAGGQTGTLLGALLVTALARADDRSRLAGLCLGCLSFKPQLGLAFIAILPQRPRLLPAAAAVVASLLALSLWWQGVGLWLWFLQVAGPTGLRFVSLPWRYTFAEWSVSCFMMARSFGAGLALAWALQAAAGGVALALIARAWRPMPAVPAADPWRRMAFTVSLSALIMPYGFLYDMTGFGIAMAVMLLRAAPAMRPVFAVLWLASGFSFPAIDWLGHPVFPLVAAAAAFACRPGGAPALSAALWRTDALR